MERVISFTSIHGHDINIIDDIEKEEVYLINRTIGSVIIIKDIKNMVHNVCNEIIRLAPSDYLEQIIDKLEEPYKSEFMEIIEENMTPIRKFKDLDNGAIYDIYDLLVMYNYMYEVGDIEDKSFDEWLAISLDNNGFLMEVK